jgi:hypothetical protein
VRKLVIGFIVAGVFATTGAAAGAGDEQLQLGQGQRDGVGWSVSLRDALASESSRVACLEIALLSRQVGSESLKCEPVRSDLPLFDRLAIGQGNHRITVFAAVMPPAVKRVALSLASRGYQKMRVRHLSVSNADSVGVEPFAYLTRSFAGPVCIKRLRAYDDEGATITDISFFRCHES